MSMLKVPLDPATVVVAVDPGKVMNRVWVSDGAGWLEEPVSVPVSCAGVEQVQQLLWAHPSALAPVIAVEAPGSLHQAFVADLERRFPGSTRLFAPSETRAARTQLGFGRPGVATNRPAAFAVHSLPINRFPDAEHLYSATGLAPMYQSASISRRCRISRQGLVEHRDSLMGIAWGLSMYSPVFAERDAEYRARGMTPIQARVAIARPRWAAHHGAHESVPFDGA